MAKIQHTNNKENLNPRKRQPRRSKNLLNNDKTVQKEKKGRYPTTPHKTNYSTSSCPSGAENCSQSSPGGTEQPNNKNLFIKQLDEEILMKITGGQIKDISKMFNCYVRLSPKKPSSRRSRSPSYRRESGKTTKKGDTSRNSSKPRSQRRRRMTTVHESGSRRPLRSLKNYENRSTSVGQKRRISEKRQKIGNKVNIKFKESGYDSRLESSSPSRAQEESQSASKTLQMDNSTSQINSDSEPNFFAYKRPRKRSRAARRQQRHQRVQEHQHQMSMMTGATERSISTKKRSVPKKAKNRHTLSHLNKGESRSRSRKDSSVSPCRGSFKEHSQESRRGLRGSVRRRSQKRRNFKQSLKKSSQLSRRASERREFHPGNAQYPSNVSKIKNSSKKSTFRSQTSQKVLEPRKGVPGVSAKSKKAKLSFVEFDSSATLIKKLTKEIDEILEKLASRESRIKKSYKPDRIASRLRADSPSLKVIRRKTIQIVKEGEELVDRIQRVNKAKKRSSSYVPSWNYKFADQAELQEVLTEMKDSLWRQMQKMMDMVDDERLKGSVYAKLRRKAPGPLGGVPGGVDLAEESNFGKKDLEGPEPSIGHSAGFSAIPEANSISRAPDVLRVVQNRGQDPQNPQFQKFKNEPKSQQKSIRQLPNRPRMLPETPNEAPAQIRSSHKSLRRDSSLAFHNLHGVDQKHCKTFTNSNSASFVDSNVNCFDKMTMQSKFTKSNKNRGSYAKLLAGGQTGATAGPSVSGSASNAPREYIFSQEFAENEETTANTTQLGEEESGVNKVSEGVSLARDNTEKRFEQVESTLKTILTKLDDMQQKSSLFIPSQAGGVLGGSYHPPSVHGHALVPGIPLNLNQGNRGQNGLQATQSGYRAPGMVQGEPKGVLSSRKQTFGGGSDLMCDSATPADLGFQALQNAQKRQNQAVSGHNGNKPPGYYRLDQGSVIGVNELAELVNRDNRENRPMQHHIHPQNHQKIMNLYKRDGYELTGSSKTPNSKDLDYDFQSNSKDPEELHECLIQRHQPQNHQNGQNPLSGCSPLKKKPVIREQIQTCSLSSCNYTINYNSSLTTQIPKNGQKMHIYQNGQKPENYTINQLGYNSRTPYPPEDASNPSLMGSFIKYNPGTITISQGDFEDPDSQYDLDGLSKEDLIHVSDGLEEGAPVNQSQPSFINPYIEDNQTGKFGGGGWQLSESRGLSESSAREARAREVFKLYRAVRGLLIHAQNLRQFEAVEEVLDAQIRQKEEVLNEFMDNYTLRPGNGLDSFLRKIVKKFVKSLNRAKDLLSQGCLFDRASKISFMSGVAGLVDNSSFEFLEHLEDVKKEFSDLVRSTNVYGMSVAASSGQEGSTDRTMTAQMVDSSECTIRELKGQKRAELSAVNSGYSSKVTTKAVTPGRGASCSGGTTTGNGTNTMADDEHTHTTKNTTPFTSRVAEGGLPEIVGGSLMGQIEAERRRRRRREEQADQGDVVAAGAKAAIMNADKTTTSTSGVGGASTGVNSGGMNGGGVVGVSGVNGGSVGDGGCRRAGYSPSFRRNDLEGLAAGGSLKQLSGGERKGDVGQFDGAGIHKSSPPLQNGQNLGRPGIGHIGSINKIQGSREAAIMRNSQNMVSDNLQRSRNLKKMEKLENQSNSPERPTANMNAHQGSKQAFANHPRQISGHLEDFQNSATIVFTNTTKNGSKSTNQDKPPDDETTQGSEVFGHQNQPSPAQSPQNGYRQTKGLSEAQKQHFFVKNCEKSAKNAKSQQLENLAKNSKSEKTTLKIGKGNGNITVVKVLDDDKTCAIGFSSGELIFYDLSTKQPISGHREHTGPISTMQTCYINLKTPSGPQPTSILLTGGSEAESSVLVWNLDTNSAMKRLSGHEHLISSIIDLGDSASIATASFDAKVAIWDLSNKFTCIQLLEDHGSPILCLDFNADDNTLCTGALDGSMILYKVFYQNGCYHGCAKKARMKVGGHVIEISRTLSLPNTVITLESDFAVRVYDVARGRLLKSFKGKNPFVDFVVIEKTAEDGRRAPVLFAVDNKSDVHRFEDWEFDGQVEYSQLGGGTEREQVAYIRQFFGYSPKCQVLIRGNGLYMLTSDQGRGSLVLQRLCLGEEEEGEEMNREE